MIKKLLWGTLAGGVVMFLWSAISWDALTWHRSAFHTFSNEDAMTQALLAGAHEPGMYSVPGRFEEPAAMKKLIKGPFLFAAVRPGPMGSVMRFFVQQVLTELGAALIATLLLLQAPGLGFRGRVAFVAGIGLAGSLAAFLPEMTWWEFSVGYTLVNIADMTIGFALAGVVLAAICKPSASESR